MIQWLRGFLHVDMPPREDIGGHTICYCGKRVFVQSNVFWIFYTVTCMKCKHWWWE